MFNFMTSVLFTLWASLAFQLACATIYVTSPLQDTVCHGGQPCEVQWVDNGAVPLLNNIGPCHIGLYNGREVLIQQIDPVDVGATHSLVFTPDPQAGPNSVTYYIKFTSVNPVGNTTYTQYSTFFRIADMAGSFSSPVPSDTSPLPVPSSVLSGSSTSVSVTVTVPVSVNSPSVNPPSASTSLPVLSSPSAASSVPTTTASAISSPSSSSSTARSSSSFVTSRVPSSTSSSPASTATNSASGSTSSACARTSNSGLNGLVVLSLLGAMALLF
ncbi:hypothetical protein K474DRAFT_1657808 [Panus rudis PR-1116 ss-1]|nr:hypothetical protein K474DRAFT_1657808 [Panus rudis PR-1116 ss-1]